MKGIIIYKGKYGATRQYAEWLSERFRIPAIPAVDTMSEQIDNYDFFILGCSVYMGKLQLTSWMKENLSQLKGKKIFFFLISATPPGEAEKLQEYIRLGIPEELNSNLEVFFLPGKMKMKDLSWKDQFLLRMAALFTKDPVAKKKMLTDFDEVKKENLNPLIKVLEPYLASLHKKITSRTIAILHEYF